MAARILCVAEKPSIAKAVAGHLGGGQVRTVWPASRGIIILITVVIKLTGE
jgi:DNA topoisomerase IA